MVKWGIPEMILQNANADFSIFITRGVGGLIRREGGIFAKNTLKLVSIGPRTKILGKNQHSALAISKKGVFVRHCNVHIGWHIAMLYFSVLGILKYR